MVSPLLSKFAFFATVLLKFRRVHPLPQKHKVVVSQGLPRLPVTPAPYCIRTSAVSLGPQARVMVPPSPALVCATEAHVWGL